MKVKTEKRSHQGRSALVLFLVLLTIVLVLLLWFRMVANRITDTITKTISQQYSRELNAQMSSHMSGTVDYYYHELNTEYFALRQMENLNEEKLRAYIADVETQNGTSYLAFADEDGYIYEAGGSYLGTMRVAALGTLLNGTEQILMDNVTIGSENYILFGMSFDVPIQMEDKTIRIGLLGMNHDSLAEHIVLQSDYSGGFSSIIHTDGSYVLKNAAETRSGLNVFSSLEKDNNLSDADLAALKTAVRNGDTYFLYAAADGEEEAQYLYFAPISGTDWYFVNTLPSTFIKSSLVDFKNTLEQLYVALMICFLLIAAIIFFLQRASSRNLKKSREELARALVAAEEASSAKTDFLFNMSHDIRTPMNAILGYTDIGLNHLNDTNLTTDSFRKIKMAGSHLLDLINDILEMSRIESGKMTLSEQPMDILEAISNVTTMSQSLALAKSIEYQTEIGDLPNRYIFADALHINEVLINIISNAVKYTPEGGKVRCRIHQKGTAEDGKAAYVFEVSDNGIGMSEAFQQHLFEAFSREENTTISKTEGTGLGLAIVKKIVDMAGGTIQVHSVQNEGTVFLVDIPFRVMEESEIRTFTAPEPEDAGPAGDIGFAGRRVLLAEDNELNREIATFILEDAGLEVDTAEDGISAVNAVTEKGIRYYDFILMDIQMPVLNGYEATRKIRALPDGDCVPIIALSANAFEEDRKKSVAEGMNDHVAKPIDIKVLLETMRKYFVEDPESPLAREDGKPN